MADARDLVRGFYEALRPDDDDDQGLTLVRLDEIRHALHELDDERLGGDAIPTREAIAGALNMAADRAAWREGISGSGLDSAGGRRVLAACRRAVAGLDFHEIAEQVRQARTSDDAAERLANLLDRIDRYAAAEIDRAPSDVVDIYRLPSGALWAIPRDPAGAPLFWNCDRGRLERDPRADRDWALVNIGQVLGSGWRKARIGTAESVPQAEAICRKQPGAGDTFDRALEAEAGEDDEAPGVLGF